ncbi:MAG: hypothetical protein N2C12_02090 [Planctomycetales bacterium]
MHQDALDSFLDGIVVTRKVPGQAAGQHINMIASRDDRLTVIEFSPEVLFINVKKTDR